MTAPRTNLAWSYSGAILLERKGAKGRILYEIEEDPTGVGENFAGAQAILISGNHPGVPSSLSGLLRI
jgi:hypothetical protein